MNLVLGMKNKLQKECSNFCSKAQCFVRVTFFYRRHLIQKHVFIKVPSKIKRKNARVCTFQFQKLCKFFHFNRAYNVLLFPVPRLLPFALNINCVIYYIFKTNNKRRRNKTNQLANNVV